MYKHKIVFSFQISRYISINLPVLLDIINKYCKVTTDHKCDMAVLGDKQKWFSSKLAVRFQLL